MSCKISSLLPGCVNFQLYEGNTFRKVIPFKLNGIALDLSGASAIVFSIRSKAGGTPAQTISLGDGITVGGTSSNELTIDKTITVAAGIYHYDLTVTDDGEIRTYLAGTFLVINDMGNV